MFKISVDTTYITLFIACWFSGLRESSWPMKVQPTYWQNKDGSFSVWLW